MVKQLRLGDTTVDVIFKEIKNVHLSVHPPTGRVRISAPTRMNLNTIRAFAISRLGWIRKHQAQIQQQAREAPRDYMERETHALWGRHYLMQIVAEEGVARVELQHTAMILHVRPGTDSRRRHRVLREWYRSQLKEAILPLRATWECRVGAAASDITVRRMKTRWGSCSPRRGTIRINLELAKKPRECLEYILVHELVHLQEPTHGPRFVARMDALMPDWRHRRDELNRLPIPREGWET